MQQYPSDRDIANTLSGPVRAVIAIAFFVAGFFPASTVCAVILWSCAAGNLSSAVGESVQRHDLLKGA